MEFYITALYEKNSGKPEHWAIYEMGNLKSPLALINTYNMEKIVLRYLNEIGPELTKTLVKLAKED